MCPHEGCMLEPSPTYCSAVNISDSPKSTLVFWVQFAGDAGEGPLNKVFCLIFGYGYLE